MAGGRFSRSFLTEEEKKDRPKMTRELLLRITGYLRPYWKQILLVLLIIGLTSVLSLVPALLTGRIIDEGLIARDTALLIRLVLLSLGLTILSNLIGVLESHIQSWVAQHISFDMRTAMYRHLQTMSQRFFTNRRQGEIITRMTSDIAGVEHVIAQTFTSILRNIITLTAVLAAMFQVSWQLAVLGLILVPLFILPARRAGKQRWLITGKVQENTDEINSILNETLSVSGQLLVKLFGQEESEYRVFESASSDMIGLKLKENLTGRWFRLIISTFMALGPMMIYLAGGLLLINADSGLSVGDITVMAALLTRMYQPVNSLLSIQVDVIRSLALFSRIFEYMDLDPEIQSREDSLKPESLTGHLRFDKVSFAYDTERGILNNISFEVASGRTLALVGPSGSGKSTITSLIPRLYDTTEGQVLMDGMDVRDLDLKTLRGSIAMVTQDTYLFNSSIRENLLYAKPDASKDEIETAARRANIHDFIVSLPQGYDTVVGNRGLRLSGGEKQRISIARAILKDPALLILDEATSSLDSISEALIQDALKPLLEERTAIVIAHRLSTIMAADEILVISNGRIDDRGTHTELLAQNDTYRTLYETQFREALEA